MKLHWRYITHVRLYPQYLYILAIIMFYNLPAPWYCILLRPGNIFSERRVIKNIPRCILSQYSEIVVNLPHLHWSLYISINIPSQKKEERTFTPSVNFRYVHVSSMIKLEFFSTLQYLCFVIFISIAEGLYFYRKAFVNICTVLEMTK